MHICTRCGSPAEYVGLGVIEGCTNPECVFHEAPKITVPDVPAHHTQEVDGGVVHQALLKSGEQTLINLIAREEADQRSVIRSDSQWAFLIDAVKTGKLPEGCYISSSTIMATVGVQYVLRFLSPKPFTEVQLSFRLQSGGQLRLEDIRGH